MSTTQELLAAKERYDALVERLKYARATTEGRQDGWEAGSDNRFIEGFLLASRYAIEDFNYILTGEYGFGA